MKVARRYEPEGKPVEDPAVDLPSVALALFHKGWTNRKIAEALGVDEKRVGRWITKAVDDGLMGRLPPAHAFNTRLNCTCEENPLKAGELLVCVECQASGYDWHPKLHANPLPKDKKPPKADGLRGGTGDKGDD